MDEWLLYQINSRGKAVLGTALLAVVMIATAGCRSNPVLPLSDDNRILSSASGNVLVSNPKSPLPDVPAPIGFDLISGKSAGRINTDGTRQVHHVYQGLGDFAAAVEYYRSVLARNGWKSTYQAAEGRETILGYKSTRETLEIRIAKPSRIMTITVIIQGGGGSL